MRRRLAVVMFVLLAPGCGAGENEAGRTVDDSCTADLKEAVGPETELNGPTWSPDGRRIAFAVHGVGQSGIYAITVSGCAIERLGPQGDRVSATMPDWSSTGVLAFDGTEVGTTESGIYTMRSDGSDVRRVTDGPDLFPEWSPGGTQIAFVRDRGYDENDEAEDRNVWVVGADGAGLRQVTRGRWHGSADWSPDGRRLVTDHVTAVSEVRLDGTGRRVLAEGELAYPSWSPDGSRLLFGGLALAAGDGGRVEQLDTPPAFEPEWSPDGGWIAFMDGEGDSDLWIVRPDGSGLQQLTRSR